MSDINYNVSYRVSKGFLVSSVNSGGVTASMAEAGLISMTMTLSSSAVSISTANLASVGLAFLQNLSTSTVQTASIGINEAGSFVGFASLRAGEQAILRLAENRQYQAVGGAGARIRVDITEG